MELSVKQRQYLKGLAHSLNPVVMIGDKGLTDAVIKEVITNLNAHELIKIRVLGDDRELRTNMIDELCSKTGASLVQHIGKLLVLYRAAEMAKIVLPKD
jgi:RNA-binding protein